ncbi:vesicle-associated membrane protein [Anaeramoeba ignava]|uniref:Vesicle-associated membrane protein n=1 Tax=Anaeramoeba ignava TaxID=1746090 RepID=A0A9Q0RED1_ANAIG|nr:vesicle-associated membrane protein [Anaeramoeba ignava]
MSIIYALVSRGTTVLAEYTESKGNFTTVCQRILSKIGTADSKMTYMHDRYVFNYVSSDGLIYLCMTDQSFERRIAFAFLQDIQSRFTNQYGKKGKTAVAYQMNDEFAGELRNRMIYFSSNPDSDKIKKVKSEIDDVKKIMTQNIEKVLERGEKIEILVDKTEHLSNQAFKFKHESTALKRHMWWKNCKLMSILVCIVLVVIFFIIAGACGGMTFKKCTGKN